MSEPLRHISIAYSPAYRRPEPLAPSTQLNTPGNSAAASWPHPVVSYPSDHSYYEYFVQQQAFYAGYHLQNQEYAQSIPYSHSAPPQMVSREVFEAHSPPILGNPLPTPQPGTPTKPVTSVPAPSCRNQLRCTGRMSSKDRVADILGYLSEHKLSLGDFLHIIFTQNDFASWATNFFRSSSPQVDRLLDCWDQIPQGKARLRRWFEPRALELMREKVNTEMERLGPKLRGNTSQTTVDLLVNFSLKDTVYPAISACAPWLISVLTRAAQSDLARERNAQKSPDDLARIIICQLANHRSQNSIAFATPFALFCRAEGTSRNLNEVLSRLGLSMSGNSVRNLQRTISSECIDIARAAVKKPYMLCWDNVQFSTSIFVEQRLLAPSKVQRGTAAVVYSLRSASAAVCALAPILERQFCSGEISMKHDIRPTHEQQRISRFQRIIHIVHALIDSSPALAHLKSHPELQFKSRRPPPSNHRTEQHPLRTTTLEESSIKGTIKVIENLQREQLKQKPEDVENTAAPSFNDRATNALLRLLQAIRRKDTHVMNRIQNLQPAPGLFHDLLNFAWTLLAVHRGVKEDPTSLAYFISLLERTRLGSPHPDYHTLTALLKQVLAGHLLYFWDMECGFDSIAEFTSSKPSAAMVLQTATKIYFKYCSPSSSDCEDEIHMNMCQLVRNLLIYREFEAGVSSGDFGRIEDMLGMRAMMYCGAGGKNYTNELLWLIQNLRKTWTPCFANVVRDNILINPSGRDGHWIGVDHNIEHNINFQKTHFMGKKLCADWELLADLSPMTHILRDLCKNFVGAMGASYHGTTHHDPDATLAINKIRRKLHERQAHLICPGTRAVSVTVDILSRGERLLANGTLERFLTKRRSILAGIVPPEDEDDIDELLGEDRTGTL